MTDLEAFASNIHTRVCPLYRMQGRRAFLVGTGIPFASPLGDYIITASHVLAELSDGIVVTAGNKSIIRFPAGSISYEYIKDKSIDADVGLLRLPGEAARELSLRFQFSAPTELGQVADYDKFTLYLVAGYPHTRNKSKPSSFSEIRATPTYLILREFCDVSQFASSGKRPEVHFGFCAPRKEFKDITFEKRVGMPQLQGMSGGGIWRVDIDRQDGSVMATALVGIGIEYHEREGALVATRIQYAMDLLRQSQATSSTTE